MAEGSGAWLVEEGIAEHRAVRLADDDGRIVAARVQWPGRLAAGAVVEARLIARSPAIAGAGGRGTARSAGGDEILLDKLPRDASEGMTVRVAVTRAAMAGQGRYKRAQGRLTDRDLGQPTLCETLRGAGASVTVVRSFPDPTEWDDLVSQALTGEIAFDGGTLLIVPTPAMTTIDIDGTLPARSLALAAVGPIAQALPRLDLGGSVAIDFPTLAEKADRRAVDEALGLALADWPHERTAMNGFGLVQIVARSERASMIQLAAWQRGAFAWRALLRRAERLEGAGVIELAIHPSLASAIEPEHLRELERRSGRRVLLREDGGLAPHAPHAQFVADA